MVTLHGIPDKHEHAAAIIREEVHPVFDGPADRGHRPLHPQQQHLHDDGDEDDPPVPPLGDLRAGGAVDGVVASDVAGAKVGAEELTSSTYTNECSTATEMTEISEK